MRSARLEQALETGVLSLPGEGRIAVIRPRAGDDLSALLRERVVVITGFRPDFDWFEARGHTVLARPEGKFAAALICLPRARAQARALICAAAAMVDGGGPVAVDGQKTDGVDALLKELRGRVALSEALSKAHGKIAVFPAGPGLEDWAEKPAEVEGFRTVAGVFSADGVDRGSALLAAHLPTGLKGKVADFGAGWGFLARAVLMQAGVKECHLVEAEADALDCARKNVGDSRAFFHWADATTLRLPRLMDHVVMNPPFHAGRDADPALGAAFIAAAARALAPDGTLWLVANRHLPYDRSLNSLFREVQEIGGDTAFRVTRAAFPMRAR